MCVGQCSGHFYICLSPHNFPVRFDVHLQMWKVKFMKVKYIIFCLITENWKIHPLSSGLPKFTLVLLYHASFLNEFFRNFYISSS